jgi:hypothetical protein
MIGVFVGFSRIFLLGILIFKGLTARRLYKSFGVKGLMGRVQKQAVYWGWVIDIKRPCAEGRSVIVIEAAIDESVTVGVPVGLYGKTLV